MLIPKGYRFLTKEDIIQPTDMFVSIYKKNPEYNNIAHYIPALKGSIGRNWGFVYGMASYIRLALTPKGNKRI